MLRTRLVVSERGDGVGVVHLRAAAFRGSHERPTLPVPALVDAAVRPLGPAADVPRERVPDAYAVVEVAARPSTTNAFPRSRGPLTGAATMPRMCNTSGSFASDARAAGITLPVVSAVIFHRWPNVTEVALA